MRLIDLTTDVSTWLRAHDVAGKFTEWVCGLSPEAQVGFSGLGPSPCMQPGTTDWDDLVTSETGNLSKVLEPLLEVIEQKVWHRHIMDGIERSEKLFEQSIDHVDVIVSVGLGRRNASMGYWEGRGLAFLWLEHFLDKECESPYLNLGVDSITTWLTHEIAHAVRYSLPGTRSLTPKAFSIHNPWMFWSTLEALPLWERFIDEGLATSFTKAALPEIDGSQIIGMTPEELRWLEDNWTDLIQDRWASWDFSQMQPASEWIVESLCYHPDRSNPPWTLHRPPSRWGYFAGWQIVTRQGTGSWTARIGEDSNFFNWRHSLI